MLEFSIPLFFPKSPVSLIFYPFSEREIQGAGGRHSHRPDRRHVAYSAVCVGSQNPEGLITDICMP